MNHPSSSAKHFTLEVWHHISMYRPNVTTLSQEDPSTNETKQTLPVVLKVGLWRAHTRDVSSGRSSFLKVFPGVSSIQGPEPKIGIVCWYQHLHRSIRAGANSHFNNSFANKHTIPTNPDTCDLSIPFLCTPVQNAWSADFDTL